ncbi:MULTISPECIES: heme ABC exporter ATP-binding protein CcmA [unclassified Devosia]|uniref:heme ABC exporter ATP-binding protein CcmA n=1 Tax=unclassified Devosia TaxID=196773 RepID=UPI00145CE934|nr:MULTISPECIES: heme ABC exporter ATP-binding protein CcmA [unclassified Devosia]MBJ6988502.1 heme ABC exporter ATP-binding protein CcmA [Devosia sp. MC521]QMW62545.1 heme ABC exporter ATP-binding protein CcmA [Devosia sp. MC521]
MTHRQVQFSVFIKALDLCFGRGESMLGHVDRLEVSPGEGLLLRGPNGVGKSTLLLTLAGLIPALDGTIEFVGHDPEDGPAAHYCGHKNAVRARLGVAETLGFWAGLNGRTGVSIDDALAAVGLSQAARLDAGYLSAGQQRRLALARLLVSERPVWFLDEPTAALDTAGQALLAELLRQHLARGGSAVIATHDDIPVEGLRVYQLGAKA